nr:transposase [Mycoplasmopsis bovis]
MAIPVEIRQVERPKNTVVKNYFGKFKVVKRTSKYVNGKAIPKDLAIVGEIVDYKFVPFETPVPVGTRSKKNQEKTDIKDYGNIAIFTKNSNDILEKLLTHFDSSTAYKLYVIAILRCAYPKAVNRDLKFYYETSFMSELFKKVGLSESLLPDFFEKTGRAYSNIHNFMLDRINEFKGFKDLEIAGKESVGNYQKHLKRNTFNIDEFNKNNQFFGVIVFESNVDLSLEDVYTLYDQRWEIEEMFNFYKNILELSKTRVHSEMKVYTTEFINLNSKM